MAFSLALTLDLVWTWLIVLLLTGLVFSTLQSDDDTQYLKDNFVLL